MKQHICFTLPICCSCYCSSYESIDFHDVQPPLKMFQITCDLQEWDSWMRPLAFQVGYWPAGGRKIPCWCSWFLQRGKPHDQCDRLMLMNTAHYQCAILPQHAALLDPLTCIVFLRHFWVSTVATFLVVKAQCCKGKGLSQIPAFSAALTSSPSQGEISA